MLCKSPVYLQQSNYFFHNSWYLYKLWNLKCVIWICEIILTPLRKIKKISTRLHQKCSHNSFSHLSVCPSDRLDRQTQATTFIHQVFGGYLRSRGKSFVVYSFLLLFFDCICKVSFSFVVTELTYLIMINNDNYMNLSFSVKCLNCKAVSDTFDPFLDIPLEIKVIFLSWD